MAGYNNDPNAVRYNQRGLLPNLVIVPNESREQAKALPGQILNEYGLPALQWAGGQLAQNAAITGLTGKSLADWLVYGGNRALNNPKVLSGIAAIGATRFGTPVINGVKFFANSPAGEKVGEVAKKAINWIF